MSAPNYSFIYLASQSPRRQELLHQLGVSFELLLAKEHEDTESLELQMDHESSLDYVQRVTLVKLEAAKHRWKMRQLPWAPILCADTTVAITLNDHELILGKPEDTSDAKRILGLLSGQTHQVHTAIAVLTDFDSSPLLKISSSSVTFKPLSPEEIDTYVASQEPMGKAGAYGIQGKAGALISHISGSFSGIMGLPLFETAQILQESGVKFSNR